MRNLSAFMLITICAAGQAVAQDSGWFVTGQFGSADYDTTQKAPTGFFGETDDDSFSWALGLGYDFNQHFAVRGMFERSTDHSTINRCRPGGICATVLIMEDNNFNNWSLVAMPRLPLGSRANVYGTLGLQYWDANGGPQLPDDSGVEFLFGGGLEFSVTPRLSIGGEAQASAADYLGARFTVRYSF